MSNKTGPARIDSLTDAQRDRMASFAQEWIERGWRTRPLTEEEWKVWEDGARKCYEYAGIPWPGVVVRVPSPIVGAFAAPIAAYKIAKIRRGAVRGAVDDAVDGAVDGAVGGAVGGAVDGAVDGADIRAEVKAIMSTVFSLRYHRLGGIHWSGWWNSYVAFFRDICELQLPGDLWDRSRAYDAAQSAGWWWPFREFVMVCDPPAELRLEQVGPTGWGSHRLHSGTGPAVAWPDGWGLYAWHGIRIPADLITDGWSVDRILKEPNSEIRRCAVEITAARDGWRQMITAAGWRQVGDTVPDPGNPGQALSLWDIGDLYGQGERLRLLHMTNGTVERDGTRHEFGETVPGSIDDPIAAAAWQIGINPSDYATTARRT